MKTPSPSLLIRSLPLLLGGAFFLSPVSAGEYDPGFPAKQVLPATPIDTGFYFDGFGGVLFLDDLSGTGSANVAADFDTGWIAGGALGYHLTPALAIELEGATGEADLDGLAVNGIHRANASGDLTYSQVTVNLIYEFGPHNPVTPYVGVGIGAGFADADFRYPGAVINDDDSAFLYQLIGGVKMDIGRRAEFFAEYRFGSLDEFTLQRGGGGVTFDELQSHQAVFGVQIKF